MAEPGRVGGAVAGVDNASPAVIETRLDHGLADGDRVRIAHPVEKPFLAYAKSSGYAANKFSLFSDPLLKQPAQVNGVGVADATIDCLAQKDFAIVVGIDVYPELTSLKGPTKDADDFKTWVLSGTGGCVPDDQIGLVKSPPYETPPTIDDVKPTLDEVSRTFQRLSNKAIKAENYYLGRRLYIFMSGHGILPTRSASPDFDEAALLMPDSVVWNYTKHIGGRSHAEWFRAFGVFDEVVLFMDCCRQYQENVAPTPPLLPTIQPQRDPARRFYAAGAELGSESWEQPFGNETRGVFTHVLLNALRNEDLCDPQGQLTGTLLKADLRDTVPKVMSNQAPSILYDDEIEMVFAKRLNPKKPNVRITFAPAFSGKTAELWGDDPNEPLAKHVVAHGQPWEINLNLDRYVLSIDGEDHGFRITSAEETKNVRIE
jgi:hypothetical protein